MNNPFYISSSCLSNERISMSVSELIQSGIKNIELSGGTMFYEGIGDDLISLKRQHDVCFLIHNYFPPPEKELFLNIASLDEVEAKRTLALIKDAIRLAEALNINMYSVHPGFTLNLLQLFKGKPQTLEEGDINKKLKATEIFYDNVKYIMRNLLSKDFKLAIENTYPLNGNVNYSLLCTPEEIWEFLKYTEAYPNLGFLLDLGHLNITASTLGFNRSEFVGRLLREYKDKVFEIHISENNGIKDTHDISDEGSWQVNVIRQHMDELEDIPVVFEWRSAGSEAVIKQYKKLTGNSFK